MGSPAAKYPAAPWDGLSANTARADRGVYHRPDPDDWDQAVSEIIATQNETNRASNTLFAATDGATVTFDASKGAKQTVTLAGSRTLAVSNMLTGQTLEIVLVQDGTGSHTVTWFSGIKWAGGSAPTLTITASKADIVSILKTGTGAYYGTVVGQNY